MMRISWTLRGRLQCILARGLLQKNSKKKKKEKKKESFLQSFLKCGKYFFFKIIKNDKKILKRKIQKENEG